MNVIEFFANEFYDCLNFEICWLFDYHIYRLSIKYPKSFLEILNKIKLRKINKNLTFIITERSFRNCTFAS